MIETTITTRPERRVRAKPAPRAAILTVEQAAYMALIGLAFGLRLYALGGRPLTTNEAQQALTVWNFARGLVVEPTQYTPPLFYSSLLSLLIAGANDLTVRIPALLFGAALVGLPYWLRSWLGRSGALATAVLLAISPTLTFFSRAQDETIVTAALTLALLAVALGYVEQPERRRLLWLAAALGAALTAGPGIITFLVAALIFIGGSWLAQRVSVERRETERQRASHNPVSPGLPISASLFGDRVGLRQAVVLLAGMFLATATGLLVNFAGLQAALNGLNAWFGQVSGRATDLGPAYVSQILLFYEPLILVLGLVGAGFALWQRDRFGIFLATWFAAAWLVGTVAIHKTPGGTVPVLLPLILLAGMALGRFADQVTSEATLELDGLFAVLASVLAAYGLLQFANYANDARPAFLNLGLVAFAFIGSLVVLFAFAWGVQVALRGAGISAILMLAVLTIHAGTWLNYRSQDAPKEWLLPDATSTDVRRVVEQMHDLSYQRERDPDTLAVTVEAGLVPALGWYLRDFESVTVVQSIGPGVQTPLVLVSARPETAAQPGYVGQGFWLSTTWTPAGLGGSGLWRWVFFRDAPQPPQPEDVILYVKR
jgi:uncharacterized protein (TIGR03663 family)